MRLSDWLDQNDITQKAFAKRLGLTQGRISQVCTGGTDSLRLANRISDETSGQVAISDLVIPTARPSEPAQPEAAE